FTTYVSDASSGRELNADTVFLGFSRRTTSTSPRLPITPFIISADSGCIPARAAWLPRLGTIRYWRRPFSTIFSAPGWPLPGLDLFVGIIISEMHVNEPEIDAAVHSANFIPI